MDEREQRVRAYIADRDRGRFLGDVLALYEDEQQNRNRINPATTLADRLGVNYGTLTGWLQQARRARRAAVEADEQAAEERGGEEYWRSEAV